MVIHKHQLDYLISSCRQHADVINMYYVCKKKALPSKYMNDLVVRKRPLKDPAKVLDLIDGLMEYCDEIEEFRSKLQRLKDDLNS